MPIYVYSCRGCDRTFEVRLSLEARDTAQIRCPHCKGTDVEQSITTFVAVTSKKS